MSQHTNHPHITLTPQQAEWVDWALAVMPEYWEPGSDAADEAGFTEAPDMPILIDRHLSVEDVHIDVMDDLLYRLTVQATDISDSSCPMTAARKIWEVWNPDHIDVG